MYYLKNEEGETIRSFRDRLKPYERQKAAETTPEYEEALYMWKDADDLHFEDEEGNTLDPFTLTVEE